MTWESYVNNYANGFLRVMRYLANFADWILSPIDEWAVDGMLGDNDLANAIISLWNILIDALGEYSIVELVIGAGLIVFVIVTLIKWIIGIVT